MVNKCNNNLQISILAFLLSIYMLLWISLLKNMSNLYKTVLFNSRRTYKNFGHKPQPTPLFTTIWHGFLTFTFIGAALDWKRIATFFFGEDHGVDDYPWNPESSAHPSQQARKT